MARPQNFNKVTNSAERNTHSSMESASIPCLYSSKRDAGRDMVQGGGQKVSLGKQGVSYCGDKLAMTYDGGRVHGENPPHA